MGTFRKLLLILHSRRLGARLLGLLGRKFRNTLILLGSQEENCLFKLPAYLIDFGLKLSIPKGNSKNNITGSTPGPIDLYLGPLGFNQANQNRLPKADF